MCSQETCLTSDDENIEIDKIVKDDSAKYKANQELKNVLHARKTATDAERKLKDERKLHAEIQRQIQIEKNMKEKEAQRIANEKAKIEKLIAKHRPDKTQTPDEVDQMGTGNESTDEDIIETVPHEYKKAKKLGQIKSSRNRPERPEKAKDDPLIGDPTDEYKKNANNARIKCPIAKSMQDDIRIYYKYTYICI